MSLCLSVVSLLILPKNGPTLGLPSCTRSTHCLTCAHCIVEAHVSDRIVTQVVGELIKTQ